MFNLIVITAKQAYEIEKITSSKDTEKPNFNKHMQPELTIKNVAIQNVDFAYQVCCLMSYVNYRI